MSNRDLDRASSRLRKDYLSLKRDPAPYIQAEPLPSNILEWHFVFCGPENTPYEGGYYHGKLIFSPNFPFEAPSIYMITPNGRFTPNKRLCLNSLDTPDYYHEKWSPAWTVPAILIALLSFMLEESPMLNSINASDDDKRRLAFDSLEFNLKNKEFCDLFPDTVTISINTIHEIIRQRRIANTDVVAHNQTSNRSYRRRFGLYPEDTEDNVLRRVLHNPGGCFTFAYLCVCETRIGRASQALLRSLRGSF